MLDSVGVVDIGDFTGGRWRAATARCPKTMTHGPCAGVDTDGSCEVPGFGTCAFLEVDPAGWPYAAAPAAPAGPAGQVPAASRRDSPGSPAGRPPRVAEFLAAAATRPVIVADLPAAPLSAASLRASAAALAGTADACLLGDHGGARVQFPPSYRARLLAEEGVPAWAGINCRDRNQVAIEGEIAACADAGAVALHCVTGDHTALGHRADAAGVFDLDSVGVVELAAAAAARSGGPLCSVAHAPAAPPAERRLPRLLAKIDAGADAVFVDHCGGPGPVADAVGELRAAGFTGLVLICVPVVTSAASAAVIASFAGARLPPGYLERITGDAWAPPANGAAGAAGAGIAAVTAVEAAEIEAAGIAECTELAERMLEIPGVDGVNLSGGAPPGQEAALATAMAEIARRVLGVAAPPGRRGRRRAAAGTGAGPS
ncbi:methylenetetrahydrofolate reductase C-terminal domain-containing protein [Pseudofrankia sp. BMG5.37]|uniref:methylenetetrahydrofolate reductase C-terminal domain-containing protein n=1 Tax=Pseudofrankia sp. BMG5.37 TaxID=3050035 RepID=UPI002895F9AD|nr:methylenetetrahydrofolate reductase C-terminal domain-containing protein [Pseudofrankia sp. BMG5.37]MDT3442401.1 methylenetetrahydrofolate reductase C-terminal domain-containing protein [Pseudofrankia sp. BMG5.37]